MSEVKVSSENRLKDTVNFGQSIWYDGLVSPGQFKKLINEDGIRGATTNPTIFEKAIQSDFYSSDIQRMSRLHNEEEVYRSLAVKAVQDVADAFIPVFQETRGQDGFVSIEVSPLLAYQTEETLEEARLLWRLVNRKNLMIKVPATQEGLPVIRSLIRDGIHVNVTLIFSIQRYRQVMDAYLLGLEDRQRDGKTISLISSVASFFVSRVDSAVDKKLEEIIRSGMVQKAQMAKSLIGQIAIANSKVAYDEFQKTFLNLRFEKLKQESAQVQRPLWASTGTKNPSYSDVLYVEALMGPQTVNTIPPPTMDAFRDHGVAGNRLGEKMAEAYQYLKTLKDLGVDLSVITQDLEKQGVELFQDSYRKIIQSIRTKRS